MLTLDQSLVVSYHVADLQAAARKDALARAAAPHPLRALVRRLLP